VETLFIIIIIIYNNIIDNDYGERLQYNIVLQ